MHDLTEKSLKATTIFLGKILTLMFSEVVFVREDKVLLPNGKETSREVVVYLGAVAIVPVLADGRVIMAEQFRYPIRKTLLDIPAGKLYPGEMPEQCAL